MLLCVPSFVKEQLIHFYKISDKPHIKDLPERTITAVGEPAVLTCEVSRNPEASVTWTKDGLTSIPRAQFKKNGKVLIIQDVVPEDSGVYECIAMNIFGESRTASTLIVAGTLKVIYNNIKHCIQLQNHFFCEVNVRKNRCIILSNTSENLPTSIKVNDQVWLC